MASLGKESGFSETFIVIFPFLFPDEFSKLHHLFTSAFSTTAVHSPELFTLTEKVPPIASTFISFGSMLKFGSISQEQNNSNYIIKEIKKLLYIIIFLIIYKFFVINFINFY